MRIRASFWASCFRIVSEKMNHQMGYSLKLKIDNYKKKDGTSAVFLQVIINRRKERIGLDFSWPSNRFSVAGGCRPRFKGDEEADVYNVVIDNARRKAAEIRKQYLLRGWHLTLEAFMAEFTSDLNKGDFVKYFEGKSFDRWKVREISDETYAKEKVVLGKLTKFAIRHSNGVISFSSFSSKWAPAFDKFLKGKDYKNDDNTRWGNHKIIQTYLSLAREDKIVFDDPYSKFVNRTVESSWGPLELHELKKLIDVYNEWKVKPLKILRKDGVHQEDTREGLTYSEVCILRKFLFACNTALRVSDLQKLDEDLFNEARMSITPHKTERWGTKINSLPINDIAKMLLEDEIEDVERIRKSSTNKGMLRIFERYVDQAANRYLKRIAEKVGINKNLHMHVGRYTYGSLMDQAGANHTALMKLMGIRKRDTLEKYMKTNSTVIEADVSKLNSLLTENTVPAV